MVVTERLMLGGAQFASSVLCDLKIRSELVFRTPIHVGVQRDHHILETVQLFSRIARDPV